MKKRIGFLDRIRNNAKVHLNPEPGRLLKFMRPNGTFIECGKVGEPTEYSDADGTTIHLGDVVWYTFGNHRSKACVVKFGGVRVSVAYSLTGGFVELSDVADITIEHSYTEQISSLTLHPIVIIDAKDQEDQQRRTEIAVDSIMHAIRQHGTEVITIDSVSSHVSNGK